MPKSKVRKRSGRPTKPKNRPQSYPHHRIAPRPESRYIIKAGTLKVGTEVLHLPEPLIIRGDVKNELSSHWAESNRGASIGMGTSDSFLNSLAEETQQTLTASAANAQMATAYEEMFAWGFLRPAMLDSEELREWLDDLYLGTWEDPTFAVGAFLRDLDGSAKQTPLKRRIAYERLAQMAEIREQPLGNGRTIVFLDRDFDDQRRFLANQYMIHGTMPEIVTFG